MPKPRTYIPKLSRHVHGQAFVKIGGQQIWLGRYGEPLTQEKYDRYVAVWLANGRSIPQPTEAPRSQDPSVLDLLADYWRWAKDRYTPAEATTIRSALRIVERLYGSEAASRFGPNALRAVRAEMIRIGWTRRQINRNVSSKQAIARFAQRAASGKIPDRPHVTGAKQKLEFDGFYTPALTLQNANHLYELSSMLCAKVSIRVCSLRRFDFCLHHALERTCRLE